MLTQRYHSDCPFPCAPLGRLSRLTIVGRRVKAHAGAPSSPPRPTQRKMTAAVITLKAADISCCRALPVCWGPDSSDLPPSRVVDLSFIKMERGFTRLKEMLECYLCATQPNRRLLYFWQSFKWRITSPFMKYSELSLVLSRSSSI